MIAPECCPLRGRKYAPAYSALPPSMAVVLAADKFAGSEFEQPQAGPKGGGQDARNKS